MNDIDYRVENKYMISDLDITILQKRLQPVMHQDIHQREGCYEVRSVYFDDAYDSCFEENEAGIDERKKYRFRMYDSSFELINLEIKEKKNGLTKKNICRIEAEECKQLFRNTGNMSYGNRRPLNEWILQRNCAYLSPKVVIVYERTAYVHPTGNVRITFDRNIVASKLCDTFFEKQVSGLVPVLPIGMHVLEVKYDEVLPPVIAEQLEIGKLHQTAFSKYCLGRKAVNGEFFIGI